METIIGSLPSQSIRKMMSDGNILFGKEKNLQPASLDLSITDEIYRMKGTFLPRVGENIRDFLNNGGKLYKASLDQPLELNGVYLIRVEERLNLPKDISAYTNNKSTTGRINLQTRLVADGVPRFDLVPKGYRGDVWLEVIPRSFGVKLYPGAKLNQIRFFNGDKKIEGEELKDLYDKNHLAYKKDGGFLERDENMFSGSGITMTVDLDQDIVGYKCFPTANKVLDFAKDNEIDPYDFFEPIERPKNGELYLKRDEFYILVTKEYLRIPPNIASEMVAYDPSKGEYRSHYAGFFDPGFGHGKDGNTKGTPGVLEVYTHDNDFILRDGQPICKMVYEKVTEEPDIIYGTEEAGSHYNAQRGPKLSKHFKV